MHPLHHAQSSAKKHGGIPADYLAIHNWFDETKQYFGDARHRALRHHTAGVFWCEQEFGTFITNSDGKEVPVRVLAEQHIVEDMGFLPSPDWWLRQMVLAPTMNRVPTKPYQSTSPVEELRRTLAHELYKGEG